MVGVSRLVVPFVGALLVAAPAAAQDSAPMPDGGLSAAEATWQVRGALNVAALACRGPQGDDTVLLYNAMLKNEHAPLAEAAAGSEIAYKIRFATHWQDAQDTAMTRLYNAYARQDGHDAFCATAHDVLREAMTVEPSSFAAFAVAALPRLRAPFEQEQRMVSPLATVPTGTQMATLGDEIAGGGTTRPVVAIAYAAPPR